MRWPWSKSSAKIGELQPEVAQALHHLLDVLPMDLRQEVEQEVEQTSFKIEDEFLTWRPSRRQPHVGYFGDEPITPIAGCKYELDGLSFLCELIARNGNICEVAFAQKAVKLIKAAVFGEAQLYFYSEAPFLEIDLSKLPELLTNRLSGEKVYGIRGQNKLVHQLEWRLQTHIPDSIRTFFLSWASLKCANFRMDGVFCTRNYFVPGRNEFLVADVNDCARMLSFNEGDSSGCLFGRDQIDDEEIVFDGDLEAGLIWLLESDTLSIGGSGSARDG